MKYIDLIKKRRSVRTFDSLRIFSPDVKNYINDFLEKLSNPFNIDITIRLFDSKLYSLSSNVTEGESYYLISKANCVSNYELALGYEIEKAILELERLDIKSVIMASTFDKSNFEKAIEIKNNEVMPLVVALGFENDKKTLKERAMRRFLHSDTRNDLDYFIINYNNDLNSDEKLIFEAIRLSPSAKNIQPIRILKDNNTYHFYINHTKGFSNHKGDIQKVDLGIALAHAELVASDLGYSVSFLKIDSLNNIDADTDYQISMLIKKS